MDNYKDTTNILNNLLQNLSDLDDVSSNLDKEIKNKNLILTGGLKTCQNCSKTLSKK